MKYLLFVGLLLVVAILAATYQAANQAADRKAPPPIDAKAPAKIETASFALG